MVVTLGVFAASAQAAPPLVSGTETDLGVAMPGKDGAVRSEDAALGALGDGRYLAVYAAAGTAEISPRLFAMDMAGKKVAEIDLPAGMNVLALTYNPASKSFYVSSDDNSYGYVYEWTGGTTVTQRVRIAGHKIQTLAVAPDGAVYIGTFAPSNGRLYRWDGALRDLGQPVAGQSYVRELAVTSTHVYATNYASAPTRLTRMDLNGGTRTNLTLPSAISSEKSIEHLRVAGAYLLGRTADSGRLFALNMSTLRTVSFNDQVGRDWRTGETANPVPYLSNVSPYAVSPLFEGKYVYLQRSGAGLMRVDISDGFKTIRLDKYFPGENPNIWNGATVSGPTAFAWRSGALGRGLSVVATTIDGKLVVNSPAQAVGGPATASLSATGTPSQIWSMGTDSAGRVYAGGYNLPTGVAKYAAGSTTVLDGPQVEGFGAHGDGVYMGGYNGAATNSAPILLYDGTNPPETVAYLNHNQERPVAFQSMSTSLVAIGSIPVKNTFGGALTLFNPGTNSVVVKNNLIPNQSIISLSKHNGLIVGGSSNTGGTGVTPSGSTMAQIFTYDPSSGALKTLEAPGPSSSTWRWVAAITPDPAQAGHFWAISTGQLIQFKINADGTPAVTKNLGAYDAKTSSPSGRELGIVFNGSTMFVTMDESIYAVNPETGERQLVAGPTQSGKVTQLVSPDNGQTLFFARGVRWFKYTVASTSIPADPCTFPAPTVTSHQEDTYSAPNQNAVFEGTAEPGTKIKLVSGSRTRLADVSASGKWSMYPLWMGWWSGPLTFTASKTGCDSKATTIRVWFVNKPTSHVNAILTSHDTTTVYSGSQWVAFGGKGTPGALVEMWVGSQYRFATVRESGRWSMRSVFVGTNPITIKFKSHAPGTTTPVRDSTASVNFG
ncbi:hypothetical protein [Janibacter sp. LM]|uniref:hypothetical protein n=1 Tax=Janibacter sp. LM TaxID=3144845 RepID=UPI0031F6C5BD